MTLAPIRSGESPALHRARSFGQLPDIGAAWWLLAKLRPSCDFGPVAIDRPLALYGAGQMGRLARDFLKAIGQDIVMAIDRDAARIAGDPAWADVRLLPPEDVSASDRRDLRVAICIATSPFVPIERDLTNQGFLDVVPFYDIAENFRHLHPLSNGWFAPPLDADDHGRTAETLLRWSDDIFRAHHLQFLAWRRLREEWTFPLAPVSEARRFFIPEVTAVLKDDETFLDGGACVGTVTQNFIEQTKGAFRKVVAIEPDPVSRASLESRLAPLRGDLRLEILDCALGERDGKALFHDGLGFASQIAETGRMQVEVRPIDGLGVAPTFIKLHLEGHELAALKGARQTLLAHRPIVAATVYHNADGIWRTPRWLMETLPNYRFLLRLDSWCGTGAVIYAIPNERSGVA